MSNAGYGVSFFGGLKKGMKEAKAERAIAEKEEAERQRQAVRDANDAADREVRNKESRMRLDEQEVSLSSAKEKAERERRDMERAAYEANMTRKLDLLNDQDALAEMERANNEDPWFDDGTVTQFEKDESGRPVIGADGTAKMNVIEKETGRVIAAKPIKAADARQSFRLRMMKPDEFNKAIREQNENERKKIEAEEKHSRDKELAGIRYNRPARPQQQLRTTRGQDFLNTRDALIDEGYSEDEATELAMQTVSGRQRVAEPKPNPLQGLRKPAAPAGTATKPFPAAKPKGSVTVNGKPVDSAKKYSEKVLKITF